MPMIIKTNQPILTNRAQITRKISAFWDQISLGWRQIWGPHIHHGYYLEEETLSPLEAQERLIEKLVSLLTLTPETKLLDVGCGMGGSSLYLAKQCGLSTTGITLSAKQVKIATEAAAQAGLSNQVHFYVEDALEMSSIQDHSIDVLWSLESCEQFFAKDLFVKEAYRVLKPGGQMMLATWCSDREEYRDADAKKYQKLCRAFDLPYMPTIQYYQNLLTQQGFAIQTAEEWTRFVAKSWEIGVSLASAYDFLQLLKLGGWRGLRFAQQIRLMRDGFREGRVRYGVFVVNKPSAN